MPGISRWLKGVGHTSSTTCISGTCRQSKDLSTDSSEKRLHDNGLGLCCYLWPMLPLASLSVPSTKHPSQRPWCSLLPGPAQ